MALNRLIVMTWLSLFCFASQAEEIRLFTWEEYFSQQLLSEFEENTGHTVKQVYFDNESLRDDVVYSGKATAYDLFILDGYTAKVLGKRGILGALDKDLLGSLEHFSIEAKDACGQYGVPYSYGTIGIGYRSSKVQKTFNSWADIFDYIKQNPNKAVMPSHGIDTVAIALMALGYHPMTSNEAELKEAFELLKDTVGDLLSFRNTLGYAMDKGKKSEMEVSVFYSGEKGQISLATEQNDWEYIVPEEGTLIWYECLSTHIDKPMSTATIEFLQFITNPQHAINNAQNIWFTTANKDALKLADDKYLKDRELFPVTSNQTTQYYYEYLDDRALKVRNNIVDILITE